MTEDEADPEEDGVPDSDPRHIDPAGDMADLVESGEFDLRADPALEATVRIARGLLEDGEDY